MLSFKVKNLGRIAEADYTAAPLTLLIGQNDTGKSYLATLVWLLARPTLLRRGIEQNAWPTWITDLFAQYDERKTAKAAVGSIQAEQIINILQKALDGSFKEILSRVYLYHEGFDAAQIKIRLSDDFKPFEITLVPWTATAEKETSSGTVANFSRGGRKVNQLRLPIIRRGRSSFYFGRVVSECIGMSLFGDDWDSYKTQVYIPAARTGLMLALRSLISQRLDEYHDEGTPELPLPISDFLRNILNAGYLQNPQAVASWLEQSILHGTLDVTDDEVPVFNYLPENSSAKVPLHATSSMITEIAPFIHLLKGARASHFVFEEPEAHLHLSAQRQMARAIARLLNEGVRFTITTHSDTFVQQINNLMRLHGHPAREKLLAELGYDDEDVIDPMSAKAYEFVQMESGTKITELERTDEGFVVPSLNETLLSLSRETIGLNEEE